MPAADSLPSTKVFGRGVVLLGVVQVRAEVVAARAERVAGVAPRPQDGGEPGPGLARVQTREDARRVWVGAQVDGRDGVRRRWRGSPNWMAAMTLARSAAGHRPRCRQRRGSCRRRRRGCHRRPGRPASSPSRMIFSFGQDDTAFSMSEAHGAVALGHAAGVVVQRGRVDDGLRATVALTSAWIRVARAPMTPSTLGLGRGAGHDDVDRGQPPWRPWRGAAMAGRRRRCCQRQAAPRRRRRRQRSRRNVATTAFARARRRHYGSACNMHFPSV